MEPAEKQKASSGNRIKFIIGGLLIVAAIAYLIATSTKASAQYFLTISELNGKGDAVQGRDLRISGAVVGDSIKYDSQNLKLTFLIADIPGDNKEIEAQGGLAKVLHQAVIDSNRPRLQIVYDGVKPDLLRNEAQAIVTGQIGSDGAFHANELLLKCPTKYEDAVPQQVDQNSG